MEKNCDNCIHNNVCNDWAHTSGIPFVNCELCDYYFEQQKAKKVKWLKRSNKSAGGYCPRCGQGVQIMNTFAIKHRLKKSHYCEWCGQLLDWGEDPFKENSFFSKLKEYIKDSFYENPLDTIVNFIIIIGFFNWIALIIFIFISNLL